MATEAVIRDVYKGEAVSFRYEDADQADLSAKGLKFELLATRDAATALVTLAVGSGITLDETDSYAATVSLSASNLNLTPDTYYYVISYSAVPRVTRHGPFVLSSPRAGT